MDRQLNKERSLLRAGNCLMGILTCGWRLDLEKCQGYVLDRVVNRHHSVPDSIFHILLVPQKSNVFRGVHSSYE